MILISKIVTAFNRQTIGTKVLYEDHFIDALAERLKTFQFPENGQGYVPFDEYLACTSSDAIRRYWGRCWPTCRISAGIAKRANVPIEGYHLQEYRGEIYKYADRKYAEKPEHLACIVYTLDAYMKDPDVDDGERYHVAQTVIAKTNDTPIYVLVAVLATVGPKPPVSSYRFVRNLAGGNNAYTAEQGYTLEKAVADCKAIAEYEQTWVTVADKISDKI